MHWISCPCRGARRARSEADIACTDTCKTLASTSNASQQYFLALKSAQRSHLEHKVSHGELYRIGDDLAHQNGQYLLNLAPRYVKWTCESVLVHVLYVLFALYNVIRRILAYIVISLSLGLIAHLALWLERFNAYNQSLDIGIILACKLHILPTLFKLTYSISSVKHISFGFGSSPFFIERALQTTQVELSEVIVSNHVLRTHIYQKKGHACLDHKDCYMLNSPFVSGIVSLRTWFDTIWSICLHTP